jgi:hypothetical protein
VGSHLGWHSTMCWPLRSGRGTYTQKTLKIYRKKKYFMWSAVYFKADFPTQYIVTLQCHVGTGWVCAGRGAGWCSSVSAGL